MAISQAICDQFKLNLLEGEVNLRTTGNTFFMALYYSNATLSNSTATYIDGVTEVNAADASGYTKAGKLLTNINPSLIGATAIVDWADITWSAASINGARGALIYNNTANTAVGVFDFGANAYSTNGDFTVVFPTANATAAVIRIA